MSENPSDKRRQPRIPLDQIPTEIEFEGKKIPVKICDLTDQGLRLSLKGNVPIKEQSRLSIGVGRISPNIQGRVRWVGADKSDPEGMMLGVEFEAFLLEQPEEDEERERSRERSGCTDLAQFDHREAALAEDISRTEVQGKESEKHECRAGKREDEELQ